jgi:hypothetical protein
MRSLYLHFVSIEKPKLSTHYLAMSSYTPIYRPDIMFSIVLAN